MVLENSRVPTRPTLSREPHIGLGADGAGGCCRERADVRQALLPTALSFPVQKIMR